MARPRPSCRRGCSPRSARKLRSSRRSAAGRRRRRPKVTRVAIAGARTPWNALLEEGRDEQLVRQARYGALSPELAPLPAELHPALSEALERTGVTELYSHQAEALAAAREGHTIVT